ncbi:LOW QUALITY PROTEIN: elongation factor 1-gamma-like [Amphiura filiformis]|uniref:LOW QUALITY PROTEIN: elongation factor 1-gamma-like n=1 Tax=Amphiura filiformis TaxID=82378 RepID=UPI003B20F666
MATGTLYTYPDNFRAYKVQIAAQYSGANVTVAQDPPQFVLGETNKSAEFLKKFPLGKVPAFEGKDGVRLSGANAIAFYVGNDQLRGTNVVDQSLVQMFVNLADSELEPAVCTWVFPTMDAMQYNKQNTDRAKEELKKSLAFLNEELKTRTYLVGERITLADISVACNLLLAYKQVFEPGFRNDFGNVNRWFTTLINQPQFKSILGEVTLCEKMAQFDAKAFAQMSGGGGKGKEGKGKDKKEKKDKGKQAKKETKQEEAQQNDVEPPKPKKKEDPFAKLPKSDFDMDAWKRMYSNNDTLTTALPYFWEKIDKEGYSIWFCEYQYPDDLRMSFMASNLIGGMFQRLEKMKKHAFASLCIFPEGPNKHGIQGVWFWRGQDLIFEKSDDWQVDYESYKWTKLDINSEDTKKKVQEYFSWEGDFNGKTVKDGKVYK